MKVLTRRLPRLLLALATSFILFLFFFNSKNGSLPSYGGLLDVRHNSLLLFNYSTPEAPAIPNAPPSCTSKKSIIFIKTHKSGSTTLIATFQKYAYLNGLSMMVPNVENNMFNWPMEFRPNIDNVKNVQDERFDMLVNHIIFNKTSIAPLMSPEAQYVTILRDPLAHLSSSFRYFDVNANGRLGLGVEGFKRFLTDPAKYDATPYWMKNVLPLSRNRINSLTRNLQAADLGLSYWDFDKPRIVDEFMNRTMKTLQFVVILERIDESLVLLRRHMCWRMQDIIFISKNVNPTRLLKMNDYPGWARINAYKWNNVDLLLYQAANRRLDDLRSSANGLDDEVAAYRTIQRQVTKYCNGLLREPGQHKSTLTIKAGRWNEGFLVDSKFCVLLLLDERDLTHVFKCKQHPEHKDCQEKSGYRAKMMLSMIEGEIEYKQILMTPRTS